MNLSTIDTMAIIYPYLGVAFTLLVTILGIRRLKAALDDFRATLLYFLFFFILLFAIPVGLIFFFAKDPFSLLSQIGFSPGKTSIGFPLILIGIPIAVLIALVGSRDKNMQRQYPFSKKACRSLKKFIFLETAYFFLYYLPWEFIFRGILLFPLLSSAGLPVALSIQTIISTLYHIGHPESEVFASLAGGFIFGMITVLTGSFLYAFIIHALVGISTDTFLYRLAKNSPS